MRFFLIPSVLITLLLAAWLYADNKYLPDHPGKEAVVTVETAANPRYGLKPAEVQLFRTNLTKFRDLLLAQPRFHPMVGIEVRGYLRSDDNAPVVKTAPVPAFGHIIYYPYILGSKTNKPFPIDASAWQIEVFINQPGRGLDIMGTSGPAIQLKILHEPKPAGQLHGFPVYRNLNNTEFIILSSTGKPSWIPVTREEYVQSLIRSIEKDLAENGGFDLTARQLKGHQDALARMTLQERNAQARYEGSEDIFAPPLAPFGSNSGNPMVKVNPDWYDPARPRADFQLILVRFNACGDLDPDHPAISEYGNAVGLRLWETLHTSDWKAIGALLAH
jgi:hypothetical protein